MKLILHLFAGALCLCSWLAHAGASKTMTVHASRSDSSFMVKLPANPTTGYQWRVTQFNKALLALKSHGYSAPHTHLIGAGGESWFTFNLRHGKSYPKHTEMLFTYLQAWNPSSATVTKVTVTFD